MKKKHRINFKYIKKRIRFQAKITLIPFPSVQRAQKLQLSTFHLHKTSLLSCVYATQCLILRLQTNLTCCNKINYEIAHGFDLSNVYPRDHSHHC